MLTEDEIAILSSQSMATLAEWWCVLNCWGWPDDLPNPESLASRQTTGHETRSQAVMKWIKRRVGHRVISRQWNKRMSDEEHEDFFRGTYQNDRDARERHMQRMRAIQERIGP